MRVCWTGTLNNLQDQMILLGIYIAFDESFIRPIELIIKGQYVCSELMQAVSYVS